MIYRPDDPDFFPDFFRPDTEQGGTCWVCGKLSRWAYADMGWQHLGCDRYPSPEGDVIIIGGVRIQ